MNAPAHGAQPFPVRVPFVEHLGFRLVAFEQGQAALELDMREALTNSYGVAHGGVLMTLLDVAMAMAARSADPSQHGFVTIEMKTSFMRPADRVLTALGRLKHRTATLAFCEADIVDADGRICASATGTFKAVRHAAPRTAAALQAAALQADAGLDAKPPRRLSRTTGAEP